MARQTPPNDRQHFLATSVYGFDDLLRGGFVRPPSGKDGLVVLIKGPPGSGKTTLALQIARAARAWKTEASRIEVYSHEQHTRDIITLLDRLSQGRIQKPGKVSADQPTRVEVEDSAIDLFGRDKTLREGELMLDSMPSSLAWARQLVLRIRSDGQEDDPDGSRRPLRLVVVDGLNLVASAEQHLLQVEKVIAAMRQRAEVGIIIYEPGGEDVQPVDFMSDVLIEMRGEVTAQEPHYYLQYLAIHKARFQPNVLGWHQYKILESGIRVFPSIHFRIHRGSGTEADRGGSAGNSSLSQETKASKTRAGAGNISEGYERSLEPISLRRARARKPDASDESVLEGLLGSEALQGGKFTVVLGPRRAWKTLLTFDWLRAGSRKGEAGLLASLMDTEATISKQRASLCKYYCPVADRPTGCQSRKCYENIYLYHFRPGCVAPCEFFDYLCRSLSVPRADGHPIQRFLFWDLMQLEHRFPLLANDSLFLTGLVDYLKNVLEIPAVFMGAPNTRLARAASTVADNVVFCWQDRSLWDKPRDGWCFYVDRIEGKPEHGRLHFLEMLKGRGRRRPKKSFDDLLERSRKDREDIGLGYVYAQYWIEAIREMQGLSLGIAGRAVGKSGTVAEPVS